jgi:hypothetical protein
MDGCIGVCHALTTRGESVAGMPAVLIYLMLTSGTIALSAFIGPIDVARRRKDVKSRKSLRKFLRMFLIFYLLEKIHQTSSQNRNEETNCSREGLSKYYLKGDERDTL